METSAGIILYCPATSRFLLLHYAGGHWSFPKGHLEPGEGNLDAAKRELKEETAIDAAELAFDKAFSHRIEYRFTQAGVSHHKQVYFLLATTPCEQPVTTSFEHQGSAWLSLSQAAKTLTYENDRAALHAAASRLGI